MQDFSETLNNGLSCRIDWLSFTILEGDDVEAVLDDFGFLMSDFHACPKGANGYRQMLLLNGSTLRVLYDGNEGMGVHFDVSGSAMSDLFMYFRRSLEVSTPFGTDAIDIDLHVMSELLSRVDRLGHVTRLDLAIDNIDDIYFSLDDLVDILKAQQFVSKFRSWRDLAEYTTGGEVRGHTLYLGSRTSDIMLRVYDKQVEQGVDFSWVRWELELKDERASQALALMLSGASIGSICLGILKNYFRIIILDDTNKSRCSTDIEYARFLSGVESLRLYIPKADKTLDDKREWIVRQVMPTMTALIMANDGDISFLTNEIDVHAGRMSRKLQQMVTAKNPNWRDELFDLTH